jgi:hypothetical protein
VPEKLPAVVVIFGEFARLRDKNKLRFEPTNFSAELVDGFGRRIAKTGGQGLLECFGLLV